MMQYEKTASHVQPRNSSRMRGDLRTCPDGQSYQSVPFISAIELRIPSVSCFLFAVVCTRCAGDIFFVVLKTGA
jgi:hypothetical protein